MFGNRKKKLDELQKIRNRYGWDALASDASLKEWEGMMTESVLRSEGHKMYVPGFCDVCGKKSEFLLDDLYMRVPDFDMLRDTVSDTVGLCFRERMVCTGCGLNNRQRALFRMLPEYVDKRSSIYMQEQVTPSFQAVSAKYPNVTGSEYLGEGLESGLVNENGIRHEDASRMSFQDNSFDCLISQDVLEHVFDVDACLKEMYRVIKPGGHLIISVPMIMSELETRMRAKLVDGEVRNILEPVYHGDPMGGGCLLVYDYGWDLLDRISAVGFSDVHIRKDYSPTHGIIGADMVWFIIATKR